MGVTTATQPGGQSQQWKHNRYTTGGQSQQWEPSLTETQISLWRWNCFRCWNTGWLMELFQMLEHRPGGSWNYYCRCNGQQETVAQ